MPIWTIILKQKRFIWITPHRYLSIQWVFMSYHIFWIYRVVGNTESTFLLILYLLPSGRLEIYNKTFITEIYRFIYAYMLKIYAYKYNHLWRYPLLSQNCSYGELWQRPCLKRKRVYIEIYRYMYIKLKQLDLSVFWKVYFDKSGKVFFLYLFSRNYVPRQGTKSGQGLNITGLWIIKYSNLFWYLYQV